MDTAAPVISFVIPVRNDAARLERCLRSIARAHEDTDAEVIVVDNESTDGSGAAARALGARVLRAKAHNVAELRNIGASRAAGEILAFVDADHEIADTWTTAAEEALAQAQVAAAGALCHAPENGTWVQRAYGRLRGVPAGVHDVEWLGSGNMAVRRQVFEAVGGFDTSLTTCEDVDLCNRVRARGLRIVSHAGMKNIHYGDPQTLWDLFKSELWRGQDNLRVTFRSRVSWRGLPSVLIPVVDMIMLAAAVSCVAARAGGWRPGGIVAAGALLLVAAGALLRVARSVYKLPFRAGDVLQSGIVAIVYDLGRALALVLRVPHRGGTSETAVAQ